MKKFKVSRSVCLSAQTPTHPPASQRKQLDGVLPSQTAGLTVKVQILHLLEIRSSWRCQNVCGFEALPWNSWQCPSSPRKSYEIKQNQLLLQMLQNAVHKKRQALEKLFVDVAWPWPVIEADLCWRDVYQQTFQIETLQRVQTMKPLSHPVGSSYSLTNNGTVIMIDLYRLSCSSGIFRCGLPQAGLGTSREVFMCRLSMDRGTPGFRGIL